MTDAPNHASASVSGPQSPRERAGRIAGAIRRCEPIPTADAEWFARAWDQVAAGVSADIAFGLRLRAGERSPATRFALAERDRFLRECRCRHFGHLSDNKAAEALHALLTRYQHSGWGRECSDDECPVRLRGTPQEFAWRILKSHPRVLSVSAIRHVIGRVLNGFSRTTALVTLSENGGSK